MKIDHSKVRHLAFCDKCGVPKVLHLYRIKISYASGQTQMFFCESCGEENIFPKYILDYMKEL